MTDRQTIDDVGEVDQLRAVALEVIRTRLAPIESRRDVNLPLATPEDAIAVIAAVAELGAVFLQRAASAGGVTPDQLIRDVTERQDRAK